MLGGQYWTLIPAIGVAAEFVESLGLKSLWFSIQPEDGGDVQVDNPVALILLTGFDSRTKNEISGLD